MIGKETSQRRRRKKSASGAVDWSAAQKRAEAALRRSTALIEASETFASQKRSRRKGAPSRYGGGRNS
jgi:hypothetical protein